VLQAAVLVKRMAASFTARSIGYGFYEKILVWRMAVNGGATRCPGRGERWTFARRKAKPEAFDHLFAEKIVGPRGGQRKREVRRVRA